MYVRQQFDCIFALLSDDGGLALIALLLQALVTLPSVGVQCCRFNRVPHEQVQAGGGSVWDRTSYQNEPKNRVSDRHMVVPNETADLSWRLATTTYNTRALATQLHSSHTGDHKLYFLLSLIVFVLTHRVEPDVVE